MRTGPFSDPAVVTLINRYFVPLHIDNRTGAGVRYGMEPGHEDAYMILETPEIPGGPPVETIVVGRIEGIRGVEAALKSDVLNPENVRRQLRAFLAKHPDLHHPWPALERLKGKADPASVAERAELLLEEGAIDEAAALLARADLPGRAQLLRARLHRMRKEWTDAERALAGLPASPEVALEQIRVAVGRGDQAKTVELLDAFLATSAEHPDAAEAFFLRGLLHHRAGADDKAVAVWRGGLALHPPTRSLFGQRIHLTLIRQNWELAALKEDVH